MDNENKDLQGSETEMTPEEKASLTSGMDFWCTGRYKRKDFRGGGTAQR